MLTARLRDSLPLLALAFVVSTAAADNGAGKPGPLMLVGDVLGYDERTLWQRVFELAGGTDADVVVIAAAHDRPELYGGFAARALLRYGPFVDLLDLSLSSSDSEPRRPATARGSALLGLVEQANAVFFVGGAPQRLASTLFNEKGEATPLANAVRRVHGNGGLVVGGIPGVAGAHTNIDVLRVLAEGRVRGQELFRGLGLLADGWYVDQHFFSPGRFAETIVTMRQLKITYGIGVGPDTAAEITGQRLEVVGDAGVVIIDLSAATAAVGDHGLTLRGARLSFLENGDQMNLATREIAPHAVKLDGFRIDPKSDDHQPLHAPPSAVADVLVAGALEQLLIRPLDSVGGQAVGVAGGGDPHAAGFEFRFYVGQATTAWLSLESGTERYTVSSIYLDISPTSQRRVVDFQR